VSHRQGKLCTCSIKRAVWQSVIRGRVDIFVSGFFFFLRDDDVIYVCDDKLFEALRLAARCNILGWILKYFLASKTFAGKEDFGNWSRLKQGLHKKPCTIAMCRMAHKGGKKRVFF
jgi:hypothetical protein